jgi:hypothetical protein
MKRTALLPWNLFSISIGIWTKLLFGPKRAILAASLLALNVAQA